MSRQWYTSRALPSVTGRPMEEFERTCSSLMPSISARPFTRPSATFMMPADFVRSKSRSVRVMPSFIIHASSRVGLWAVTAGAASANAGREDSRARAGIPCEDQSAGSALPPPRKRKRSVMLFRAIRALPNQCPRRLKTCSTPYSAASRESPAC